MTDITPQNYKTDDVKLREYLETLIAEQRRFFESRLAAIETATDVARASMAQRLDGMNEFRDALKDQAGTMATRAEVALLTERLRTDIDELKKYANITQGKASQSSVIFFGFLSVASLFISIIKLLTGGL